MICDPDMFPETFGSIPPHISENAIKKCLLFPVQLPVGAHPGLSQPVIL